MIKHISFDLWLTLIKSHPQFKRKRAELIADKYNSKGLDLFQIEDFIRLLDKKVDKHNETSGGKVPAREMYYRILKEICKDSDEALQDMAQSLEKASNILFQEYKPILLNEDIIPILEWLKSKDYTINLSSNTGFIEADTLRIVLDDMGLLPFFSFCIFSDEIKASKPSSVFFQQVYNKAGRAKEEVLHIGDNPLTDYKGAKGFGFEALLITEKDYTLNDIKKRLQRFDHSLLGISG